MSALRINMRKLKDALRLKFAGGQTHQQIATALQISKEGLNNCIFNLV
jgi:hypothetical protein